MYSTYTLHRFVIEIFKYEPALYYDILNRMNYIFHTRDALKNAIDLWCCNKHTTLIKYGHISSWDVSLITDMSELFLHKLSFNDDISKWNTSNVTDMSNMFCDATSFNCNIGNWDVSNVRDIYGMFSNTGAFNADLKKWNVSKVEDMSYMFELAKMFNQDISNWNTRCATNMDRMFLNSEKMQIENMNEDMKLLSLE